ncbi:MAG TPA: response regulator transcription factor [Solirubrobacteraceae bacterium]|nr:response regulator transcription factor [Solirubrobacteraceae bacterium]
MLRVVVADDHPIFRAGVARAVQESPMLHLVGEACDGPGALSLIEAERPDVALLDVRMPGLDGVAIAAAVRAAGGPTQVVLLSAAEEAALVLRALDAGAAGFLSKEAGDEEICDALVRAAAGEVVVGDTLHQVVFARLGGRPTPRPELSERERQVLELAAAGRSNAAIGEELFLSAATVKSYLARTFEKLGVSDRSAAVAAALRQGLIA